MKKHLFKKITVFAVIQICCVCGVFAESESDLPVADKTIDKTIQKEFTAIFADGGCKLHPHNAYTVSDAQIMTLFYEGLFVSAPESLEPLPGYAESWSVSDDKKTWTFTLRKSGCFENGDPITAQVFIDSWKALLEPTKAAPYASMLDVIAGAESYREGISTELGLSAPDEYTLVISLAVPTEYLPKVLCHYAFSAVHSSMLQNSWQYSTESGNFVSSGPYLLTKYTGTELTAIKNNRYWDAENVAVPSVHISFTDDEILATDRFNRGEINWLQSSMDISKIVQKSAVKLIPSFSTEFFYFRCDKAPWNIVAVRKALSDALPWDEIRKDSLIPAKTLIFPLQGYPDLDGVEEGDDPDPDTLQELLESAAGCTVADFPPITIVIPAAEHLTAIAECMRRTWEAVGLKVSVITDTSADYYTRRGDDSAVIRMMSWVGDFADPMAFLELFRPSSALNEARWVNPAFDPLLKKAARQRTQEKRYNVLAKAEQLILADAVIMPISFRPSLNVVDDDIIKGWNENVLDIHPFKFIRFIRRPAIPNLI